MRTLATTHTQEAVRPDAGLRQSDLDDRVVDAAGRNDRQSLELARNLGANVHASDRLGDNTVVGAARNRDAEVPSELLGHGIAPIARGSAGFKPLTYAIMIGAECSVRQLLANGTSPNQRNPVDETPLHLAAEFGCEKIMTFLLATGARI